MSDPYATVGLVQIIGDYRIVGPHADSGEPNYSMLVLDANVVLDIHAFYFGGPSRVSRSLQALLLAFPMKRRAAVDVNYGWAVTELSWKRGAGTDLVRRRRLAHAAAQVLDWDAQRIDREFSRRHPPVNRDHSWPNRVALSSKSDAGDPRIMLLAPYGALLYLLYLERRRAERKSRGPEWALATYAEWMTNTLGVRSSYALALATGLLAGSPSAQRHARAVFKFSGGESAEELASKCWNVAWDIVMTSLSEGFSYGLLPDTKPMPAALVTRDSDPLTIRSSAEVSMLIDTGSEKIPFTPLGMELHKDVNERAVDEALSMDPLNALQRFSRNPEGMVRQAARAVNELEQELGLSSLTMHDGWML